MINKKKIVKKIVLWLGCIAGLYLLILFAAGIYINTQKKNIINSITTEFKNNLHGTASIGDLEISVWRHFPSIGFRMKGFVLSDSVYHSPILEVQTLSTSFSLFQLIFSKKTVKNIDIEDGLVHLFTDSSGYTNKYLLQIKKKGVDDRKQQSSGAMEIDDISIKRLAVIIEDKVKLQNISFVVNDLSASINQTEQLINIRMDEKISMKKGLGFNLAKGAFLENQSLDGKWKLQLNKAAKTLSFGNTIIDINKHTYVLSGKFSFDEKDPGFDISIDTRQLSFNAAKAIVTSSIRKKLNMVQLKEPLDVTGSIKGSLLPGRQPAVNIHWQTKDNTLITRAASFSKCGFAGNFTNSVNEDSPHIDNNSMISFQHFDGDWDGINLSGKNVTITNLEAPQLHFSFHSDCKLEALDDKLALKDIFFKSGDAALDLFYDGPITKDMSMMENLEGTLTVKNGTIDYIPRNFTFTNCNGDIGFYKDSISMRRFNCSYRKNQLNVEVEGNNIRRKFIVGDTSQESIIKCFIRSRYIDVEDFKSLFDGKKQRAMVKTPHESFAATACKLDNLLDNSVIGVDIKAENIKHRHLEANNLNAYLKFEPHHWELARIAFDIAGGAFFTKGTIIHAPNNTHDAVFGVKIEHVDIKKLLIAFDDFGQDAITYHNIHGNFSTVANLRAGINSQGHMIPASLHGSVDFSLKNGGLQNFSALENLKTFVFKDRDMNDVRFAEIKDKIDIKGMEVFINRMEIETTVFRLFMEGIYGLDKKNTDLLIQVPFSNLNSGSFTNGVSPKNKGTKAKIGASVWLRAVNDEQGKIKIKVTLSKKIKGKK